MVVLNSDCVALCAATAKATALKRAYGAIVLAFGADHELSQSFKAKYKISDGDESSRKARK